MLFERLVRRVVKRRVSVLLALALLSGLAALLAARVPINADFPSYRGGIDQRSDSPIAFEEASSLSLFSGGSHTRFRGRL